MNQTALFIWGISTLVILLVGFLVRRQNRKPLPQQSEFVIFAFAVAGILSGIQIIYQAFTAIACRDALGQEGTIALAISGGLLLWISCSEIWKFIFPP